MPRKKSAFLDPDLLAKMCSFVKIPSKQPGEDQIDDDSGSVLVPFSPMFQTQVHVLHEIQKGMADGKNTFVICKCRQSGITTLGIAILLYLAFKHNGIISTFVADTSKRLFRNRKLAKQFFKSLQEFPEWRQEKDEDNREMLSFKNDSEIYWTNANSDDEGGMGRSMGTIVNWLTEVGRYKDVEGTMSFFSSLPENNPNSLTVFEGTAEGPNLFMELYQDAEHNTSQHAIFVGWWLHHWYEHNLKNPVDRRAHEVYWGELPRYTLEEARWVEGVRVRYGFDIRPTQISWWRQHLAEKKKKNLQFMYQEYPPLPEDAWTYGGIGFIDGRKLSDQKTRVVARRSESKRYFQFDPGDGARFESSDLIEVDPDTHYYDLVCYKQPVTGPRVRYCLGWDPAHGANEEGDHCSGHVLLCYSDKAVQVAEFYKREINTIQQAWVILHLVGAYNSAEAETHLNIEMGGGGTEVYAEIKRLQNEMLYGYTPKLARYFQKISHYVYQRADSQSGRGSTVHWETSWKSKPRMMHALRGLIEGGRLELNSEELIDECHRINQLRSGEIETPGDNHRVMAMAIAGMAYLQLLEIDIGNQKEYSSEALKEVHEDKEPGSLKPDEIMQVAIKAWKEQVLEEQLSEIEGVAAAPEWLNLDLDRWSDERDNFS